MEDVGLRNLLAALAPRVGLTAGAPLLDPAAAGASTWGPLDDVVMGGVSESRLELVAGAGEAAGSPAAVFRGVVSVNNSGGFASVRSRNFEPALDLTAYDGLALRVKGDGQRYKIIIRGDAGWDGVAYCRSVDTVAGAWQTLRVPFSEFTGVFRARTLPAGDARRALDPRAISSIQARAHPWRRRDAGVVVVWGGSL